MDKCVSEKIEAKYLILMLAFILTCSNTLFSQVCLPKVFAFVGLFSVSLFALFLKHKTKIKRDSFYYALILIACIAMSNLLNLDFVNINGSILVVIKIITALLISQTFDRIVFWKYYKNAMLIICVYSLLFNYIYPLFLPYSVFPTLSNSNSIVFYNAVLSVKISSYGFFDTRNYGVFSEPAVFCFFIFCALLVELYDEQITKYKSLRIIIFLIALVSTFSPIGMIISISFSGLYAIMLLQNGQKKAEIIGFSLLIAISVYLFFNCNSLNLGFNSMMSKMSISEGNGKGRVDAIFLNVKYWLNRPLFGNSLKATVSVAQNLGFNTTTTGTMLSCYGIIFTILTIILQYRSVCFFLPNSKSNIQIFEKIVVIVLFFLAINNHGYLQSDFFWVFSLLCLGDGGFIVKKSSDYEVNK